MTKQKTKSFIITGGLGVIVLFGVFIFWQKYTTIKDVFICKIGGSMEVSFHNRKNPYVVFTYNKETHTLPIAISASGARYTNNDESFVFWNKGNNVFLVKKVNGKEEYDSCTSEKDSKDYKTISYGVDGFPVQLGFDGANFFGNEVTGDFDGDGKKDVAFVFTNQTGGSGTFYYLAVARGVGEGFIGTEAVFLGDRIAPQATMFKDGKIIVSYADRAQGEPFSVKPSIAKSKTLILDKDSHELGEVAVDFEGEADISKMNLFMKPWVWVKTSYNENEIVVPKQDKAFEVTFGNDGTVSMRTDCNSMRGVYTVKEKNISFGSLASTKMYCEGSQETLFASMIGEIVSYSFTSRGELLFQFKDEAGVMVFR